MPTYDIFSLLSLLTNATLERHRTLTNNECFVDKCLLFIYLVRPSVLIKSALCIALVPGIRLGNLRYIKSSFIDVLYVQ